MMTIELVEYDNIWSLTEEEDFAEERGIVAGWGRTQEKGRPSHILREVEVPIMTNEVFNTNSDCCILNEIVMSSYKVK
jgi:hypothetical protein